jgi:hypothetical protein
MKTIGEYEASLHALKATNFAQKVLKEVDNDNKDTFAKHAKTNFLAGVEWLIEEMGWRSVEDKLPENKLIFHNKYYDSGDIEMLYFTTDDVMVLLDSGKISKAKRISDDGDVWEWSLSKIEQEEIIYWREIP